MSDNLTKEQRHKNMKRICAKDTKIEIILRKALWNKGYRYRKNCKELPGKPDIVLTKYKIAIVIYLISALQMSHSIFLPVPISLCPDYIHLTFHSKNHLDDTSEPLYNSPCKS